MDVSRLDETEQEAAERRLHSGNLYRYEHWRKSTGRILEGTTNGHRAETPPHDQEYFRSMPSALYHSVVSTTCQSLAGERIALACSANLCAQAPDRRAQTYLATQVADEARHVEVFTYRLGMLTQRSADEAISRYANPRMEAFGQKLMRKVVEQKDFAAGVVGQNLALEGLALGVFDFTAEFYRELDPGYSQILEGVIADERRHVGFGVTRVKEVLDGDPSRVDQLTNVLHELSGDMLHMVEGLANIMADFGMDPGLVMTRVRKAHETHWRRIGLELPS
jgi:hypothetical protein